MKAKCVHCNAIEGHFSGCPVTDRDLFYTPAPSRGWECPRCRYVFAPSITECLRCNRRMDEMAMPFRKDEGLEFPKLIASHGPGGKIYAIEIATGEHTKIKLYRKDALKLRDIFYDLFPQILMQKKAEQ